MDRYLFNEFVFPLDEDILDNFYKFILTSAQDKVEIGDKGYYNYYPQEDRGIQLIMETTKDGHKVGLDNMFFHHTSASVWKLKIIHALSKFPNTYMVSSEDGDGAIIIRLVNEAVLGKELVPGDIIEAQVSGFAINGGIYENENDYDDIIPYSEDGKKHMLADGALMPINMILNNSAMLTDDERENKDHFKDNILSFKGTIKLAKAYDLNMFDTDFPNYYYAIIDTNFGDLQIFFTRELLNKDMKGFGRGNIIHGELFLSGDVCINDYDKYIRKNDLKLGE